MLLKEKKIQVPEVETITGFFDVFYFTKSFNEFYKSTSGEFVKMSKTGI